MTQTNRAHNVKSGTYKRLLPVISILLVGASCSVYLYFSALEREDLILQQRLKQTINAHTLSLEETINRKISALRSMQTLISYSEEVTREEFEGASRLVIQEGKGISSVEWIPATRHSDLSDLQKRARSYGYTGFQVSDVASDGSLVPAVPSDYYFPILFVFPLEANESALGLNVRHLPDRQELETSMQTEKPVASGKISLVQNITRPDGWILTIPVYESDHFKHANTLEGKHIPKGFLQAVLYLEDIVDEAFGIYQHNYVHVSIEDITEGGQPTFLWQDPMTDDFVDGKITDSVTFKALQRDWKIHFTIRDALLKTSRNHIPFSTLISGCIITALLGALIYHLLLIRYAVELQVKDRTAELQEANEHLHQEIAERRKSEEVRTQLEDRLRHSQKMEAIGTLAGGIAHDFNNILAAVIGYIELIKDEVSDQKNISTNITELEKACYRARDLIRQILTFSRQKEEQRQIIQPAPIVQEVVKLTRATISVHVNMHTEIDDDVWNIEADPTQIHQITLNLITNASHAIGPINGRIDVMLRGVTFQEPEQALEEEIPPGKYVCLVVKDNGKGMSADTIARIFEPYFTTKEVGHGTGMGLSMVHGIVRNHGGYIAVQSTPGIGTRFDIYFPAQSGNLSPSQEKADVPRSDDKRRILVVDDEEAITSLIEINLLKNGYVVDTFTDSVKCLHYVENKTNHFDLMITDSAMPEVNGLELLKASKKHHPDTLVILYTGRITEDDNHEFEEAGVNAILRKPLSFKDMQKCIIKLLNNR